MDYSNLADLVKGLSILSKDRKAASLPKELKLFAQKYKRLSICIEDTKLSVFKPEEAAIQSTKGVDYMATRTLNGSIRSAAVGTCTRPHSMLH